MAATILGRPGETKTGGRKGLRCGAQHTIPVTAKPGYQTCKVEGSGMGPGYRRAARLFLGALALAMASPGPVQAQEHAGAILKIMERAADWELAHPKEAAYPANGVESITPLGWVVGTFYTGLTELADRSPDPRYGEAIYALGEREHWALGPRPFHADDYEVAQNWVWAYDHKHDPRMIAAVRQRFDAIMAAYPQDSLLMVRAPGGVGGCFRRWCWSDALFMGPPGWMALAQATG